MKSQEKIIIKISPVVFIKRLIVIEILWALLTTWLSLTVDLGGVYDASQLERVASFSLIIGLLVTAMQIFIIVVAFITWTVEAYEVNRTTITHRLGNLFGSSQMASTQTIAAVKVSQSGLGQKFNYGSVQLLTVDPDRSGVIKNIPNPHHYATLIEGLVMPRQLDVNAYYQKSVTELAIDGEGQYVESKSSFSWDYRQQRINKDLNKAVIKNVAGFMNSTGGVVLIGVDDDGKILGLETEFQSQGKPNVDGFENSLNMAFNKMIGVEYRQYMDVRFDVIEDKTVCRMLVLPAPEPVYLNYSNKEEFYVRTGNSSQPMTISQAVKYIQAHFEA